MIRIGLIGCGIWGRNYIRNFEHLDDVEMYALCDPDLQNAERAKRLMPTAAITDNPAQLIADPLIDGIIIATPATTHYELAKAALAAGKHVLVEKPLSNVASEASELVELAMQSGKTLMVGHILEYHPATVRLKEMIDQGELGAIQYLYLIRTNLGRVRTDVNVMWDLAPHDLSIVHYLLGGRPVRVSAKGKSYVVPGIEDVVFLLLEFENEVIASIHVSWLDPEKIRRVTVIGDKKMAVFDDLQGLEKIRVLDRGIDNLSTEREFEDFGSFQLAYRYGDIWVPNIQLSEPLRNQCTHFIECIQSGCVPRTDGENGLKVVRVLEAAQRSLQEDGRFVDIE
ncbi:MAG: Gfo/Idh/MocA family protein [Candidatus Aquicultorales bacterium]